MLRFLMNLTAIGAAGFLGAVLRYLIGLALNRPWLPWGTLLINVSGAFVLGYFMALTSQRVSLSPTVVLAVGTGFVGAFTTFSTLMYETNAKLEDGAGVVGMAYLAGSVVLGMAAVKAGVMLGR